MLTSQDLIYTANLVWPSAAQIGYLAMLSGDALIGAPATVAAGAISCANPHRLALGSRIRFDGALPIGLSATVDYFAVPTGANALAIAATLANAQAATPVTVPLTAITGLLINEQLLLPTDPPNVLVNKELAAINGYQRMAINGLLPAASTGATTADHPPITRSITNTNTTSTLRHRYEVILRGASSVVGSITGITTVNMLTLPAEQATAPGQTRDFIITLGASDP